jgi:SAM-dependent methyltransferase
MGPAARNWRKLVRGRMAEMERLSPGSDAGRPAFWDGRARRFAAAVSGTAERHPLLARVRGAAGPDAVVLDVGAGSGRFALALAPHVAEVVAVDSSPAMLHRLRREASKAGLANVRTVDGRWEEVDVPPADVVLASYVLPLVEDAAGFLAKMDMACRERAFVCLNALPTDTFFSTFWRHFHGTSRKPGPTYLDALAVLDELGIRAEAEVAETPVLARFRSLQAAVADYRENLLLPDTPEIRAQLRRLLKSWLIAEDGALRPPMATMPTAIISWRPRRGRWHRAR